MSRSIDDLQKNAEVFWPDRLAARAKTSNVVPRLIESQEKFFEVLNSAGSSPTDWQLKLRNAKELPANLFLKHLMILSDVGGEKLQRLKTHLAELFPDGKMHFIWKGRQRQHAFATFGSRGVWSNKTLAVDSNGLLARARLTPPMTDVIMLLLHAGSCADSEFPDDIADRCVVGTMLGDKKELDAFVCQRYLHVSRITGGAKANAMGKLVEDHVRDYLKSRLPKWDLELDSIPGISQNAGRTNISFDIVARSPSKVYCAIEVSFQVTTNSTIERKAGQAQARQRLLQEHQHHIAYVIDGAGNFQRRSAVGTICRFSDCTVTMKDHELDKLVEFLKNIE
jgi:hypothetical protein